MCYPVLLNIVMLLCKFCMVVSVLHAWLFNSVIEELHEKLQGYQCDRGAAGLSV